MDVMMSNWKIVLSHSVVSNSANPDCSPQAALSMGILREEYWMRCHALRQGIFPIQESSLGLLHCRQILYQLSYQGNPTGKLV